MKISAEDYLKHYGTPRHSGRYPWGSGENPYQDNKNFLGMVNDMKKQGLSDTEIARGLGMSTTQLRAKKSIAKNEIKQADISQAQRLKDKGWSNVAIGERMGLPESSVRSLLAPGAADKAKVLDATSDMLKKEVKNKGIIDIGANVEHTVPGAPGTDQKIGVSRNKLDNAIAKLREEGYGVHYVKVKQLSTGHQTTIKVLAPPGMTYSEVYKNRHNIKQISEHSEDGGRTFLGIEPPKSIDSKRIAINYSEKDAKGNEVGGGLADGVIYVRPGVEDVSLGKSNYAQVRIAVDDTHFLKGMAVYKKDMPDGVDLVFNTNKTQAEAPTKHDAMKPMKTDKRTGVIDKDNPFGATIDRQSGVMNVLYEEGTWDTWSKTLSSQFLSKQSPKLAKQQLEMTYERKQEELNEIMSLTNPVVRRHLLKTFAEDADSSAVHLKAAALPKQASNVLLPVKSMKPTEIYAPNHKNGDRVVLIRHPHGGIFEIPELTVNNRNREARETIGTSAPDAVGINSKVAEKLSGADFDGDTVLVIRNNNGQVKTAPSLEGLKNFDAHRMYKLPDDAPKMKPRTKQVQMGDVSNLITDMTIKGANPSELARAVRHSMVVIDAEKHGLDYKQSALDNGIKQLKEKYQGGPRAGAATLVSRSGSSVRVPERKQGFKIDPETGKKVFTETGATYVNKSGKEVPVTTESNKLAETDDAESLSSGTPIEAVYAEHSNRLKGMANATRREVVSIKNTPYSPSARATYESEVESLKAKLKIAKMNAPRERQAQIIGNAVVEQKKQANPDMDSEELKKLKNQALAEARTRTGAGKERIKITQSEWDAIQSRAITTTMLEDILSNTDLEDVKKLATPRTKPSMTSAKERRARSMAALGYTQAEIAEQLGVSTSTITDVLSEGG